MTRSGMEALVLCTKRWRGTVVASKVLQMGPENKSVQINFRALRGLISTTHLCSLPLAAALHIKETPFLKSWIRPWACKVAN